MQASGSVAAQTRAAVTATAWAPRDSGASPARSRAAAPAAISSCPVLLAIVSVSASISPQRRDLQTAQCAGESVNNPPRGLQASRGRADPARGWGRRMGPPGPLAGTGAVGGAFLALHGQAEQGKKSFLRGLVFFFFFHIPPLSRARLKHKKFPPSKIFQQLVWRL